MGGAGRKLLAVAVLCVVLCTPNVAALAQSDWSGWYHCDIQIAPSTYRCRPVTWDWICNVGRITSLCNSRFGRNSERNNDDNGGGSGVSVVRRSEVNLYSSMNVRRIGAAGIGVQWIIDAGFINAIDVWGDDVQGEVCLEGLGSLLFLDARSSPRAHSWLDAYQRDGRTCAELEGPGTVVLMPVKARAQQCRIVTTGNLRVRAGPALDAEISGFLRRGVGVKTRSRIGDWIEIDYRGEAGWISADYVRDDCGVAAEVVSAAAGDVGESVCTTGQLRVRAAPALDAEIIGLLRSGVTVRPLSRNEYWIEIDYRGAAGWISADYVRDVCGEAVAVASKAKGDVDDAVCTTGQLRVRAGPALDADVIGFVRSGVRLNVLSRFGSWIEINYRGEAGWIGAGHVSDDCGGIVVSAPAQASSG